MNWEDIRPALLALVKTLSGNLQTVWEDQPRPYVDPTVRAVLLLSVKPVSALGIRDDTVLHYDPAQDVGEEMQDEIQGIRAFVLTIKCESYEQSDGRVAVQALERIRTRLGFRSSGEALRAVNVARSRTETVQDLGESRDGRKASIAALDVRFCAAVSETDPERYGYIETVDIAGP